MVPLPNNKGIVKCTKHRTTSLISRAAKVLMGELYHCFIFVIYIDKIVEENVKPFLVLEPVWEEKKVVVLGLQRTCE